MEIFEQFGAAHGVKAEEDLDSGEETEAARIARQNTLQLGSPVKPIEIEDSQMLQDRQPEEPYAPTPTPPKGGIKDEEKGEDEEEPLPDHEGSEKGEQEDLEEEEPESDPVLPDDVREAHKLEVVDTLQHLKEDFGVETIDEAIGVLWDFKNGIPVTSRISQFAKRPPRQPKGKGKGKKGKAKAKAKAKAKSKAKAKAKSKSKGGRKGKGKGMEEAPVEEISDEEQQEDEQNEEDQEDGPEEEEEEEEEAPRRVPRRPAAKAKGKAKAKAKAKRKANPKSQKSKSKEGDEEIEPEPMKRPSAASKEDPKEDTKKKKRAEEPEPAEPAEPEKKKKKAAHPKEPAEPEKKVRAKPGEASSFARRPCPSTSPAKTRWLAIRNTYKNDVEKQVEDAGGNARAWEDCFWSWMLRLNSILGVFVHKKKGLPGRLCVGVCFLHLDRINDPLLVSKTLLARNLGGRFAWEPSRKRKEILTESTTGRLRNRLLNNLSIL